MSVPFFSSRASSRDMVGLCRRMSISLEAGVDIRTALAREADRGAGSLRSRLAILSDAVDHGQPVSDALAATEDYFPPLFREMVQVGEESGHLDGVLAQLADHYDAQLRVRRIFLGAIIWPVIQLVLSLGVIGFLIWITGMLNVDILGLGLTGNRGLRIYLTFLALAGIVGWLVIRAARRGLVWTWPIQRLVLNLPVIGRPLQTMALARLAWSMHLTMNTGMNVRRALALSLRSTQNARYTSQIPTIDAEIAAGNSIFEAFRIAGGYPPDFLDTLAVGEQSGKVVESMGNLARQYQEQARIALTVLGVLAGWGVWMIIAAFIIILIFRLALFYVGTLNQFLPR